MIHKRISLKPLDTEPSVPHNHEQAVLALVEAAGYRPLKPRQIAERLGLPRDQHPDLKKTVKRLVKSGRLEYGSNHLVLPAGKMDHDRLTGTFRRAQGGFGFVRPSGAGPQHGPRDDIYIAAENSGDASSGDVVLVRVLPHRGRRRPNLEGVIVEVIERDTHEFVGTYFEAAGAAFVQVDGTLFSQPIAVGDPGAKNAKPDDKVVFEMVRFPSFTHSGEGVIVDVLGPRGAPGVDTQSIIREFGLPEAFPEGALEAARREAERFDEADLGGRLDLTDETIITIDPVDARDFDDAISLEKLPNGHWQLGVHIADVAHFVKPGTELDREAQRRATSVYLPDRVLPMLPEIISNSLASLQPDRVRYTKSVHIELTEDGAFISAEMQSAAIRSKRRFTYEEVDEYLADREAWKKKLAPEVHALLGRMHELAMILRRRRFARGALELSLREVKVDLDRDGRVSGAHVVENTESHQIIEEFMLTANESVAGLLAEAKFDFLRRVHPDPDPFKLRALTEFVSELGIETDSLESRFEIQRLLERVHGQPEEHAVNYAVLRSLQRAVYSPEDEGHYALNAACYCHFTSPIRRYPDLTVHRLVDLHARRKRSPLRFDDLVSLGEHCSLMEQRAEAAERELTKVKLLTYLSDRIGEQMDAIITGVMEFGIFAIGVDLPAEGFVHVNALSDDFYRYDRRAHTLSGHRSGNQYRLGDRLRVAIARVDVDRRELDLRILAHLGRAKSAAAASPAKGGKGKDKAARVSESKKRKAKKKALRRAKRRRR